MMEEKIMMPGYLLDYDRALEAVKFSDLSPGQQYLTTLLLTQGRSFMMGFEGLKESIPILDVTLLLNHRIDGKLLRFMRDELGPEIQRLHPNVILTAATSGIAPATALDLFDGNGSASIVVARKGDPPITMEQAGVFRENSRSYTGRGRPTELIMARNAVTPGERVAISDEFLDYGVTSVGLARLVAQAKAVIAGFVYIIEKSFSGGRLFLKDNLQISDENIISWLKIEAEGEGWMKVAGVEPALSFRRK